MPPLVGAPERGPSRKLLQLEFKIRTNFGASKGASWGPVHARIMEIGRAPVECERAARGGGGVSVYTLGHSPSQSHVTVTATESHVTVTDTE